MPITFVIGVIVIVPPAAAVQEPATEAPIKVFERVESNTKMRGSTPPITISGGKVSETELDDGLIVVDDAISAPYCSLEK